MSGWLHRCPACVIVGTWLGLAALATPSVAQDSQAGSQSSSAAFDYKELRKELAQARAKQRPLTGKILGLPTESFRHAAPPSGLRTALSISNAIKALCKYAACLKLNQGGAIWLWLIILGVLGFDRHRLLTGRNACLALLLLMCLPFLDLINIGLHDLKDPSRRALTRQLFSAIFVLSVFWLVCSLVGAFRSANTPWAPAAPRAGIVALALLCGGLGIVQCLSSDPDDCGRYTNIGAKRLRDTGMFPYGDPMLRGGAPATYGPVLYLSHIPFQFLLPDMPFSDAMEKPATVTQPAGGGPPFVYPPVLATKLCALSYHLLALLALLVIGRQLANAAVGWALVCFYAGSAFVQGLGGSEDMVCGITYISHIAPTALILLAFAWLGRPLLAGAALALATGVLFFPAFFAPAWLGHYVGRRRGAGAFLAGFAGVGLLIAALVLTRTRTLPEESALHVVVQSTVAHEEHEDAYGNSPFGFWGTQQDARAFWQRPLVPGWFMLKPAFLAFLVLVAASFFLARGRNRTQFAFLVASIAIGVQLWKSHATGTYVEWYLPFLLIGLFTADGADPATVRRQTVLTIDAGAINRRINGIMGE